jgi:hypothetical protein
MIDQEEILAIANDYEAGLKRALASGYEEFGPTWERRQRFIIAALHRYAQRAPLREALENCVETLALVEHPRMVDPHYGEIVQRLGEQIGYGALMSSASASWRQSLAAKGYPVGGEFVAGPCYATVVDALKKARAALTSTECGEDK